jgi:hypothetical protein
MPMSHSILTRPMMIAAALCCTTLWWQPSAVRAENFYIENRVTPNGFECEARFLELLRNSDSSLREFKVENAPHWDLSALAEYFSESGLDLTDVNGPTHSHAEVGSILASLRARKGKVFAAFSHLSSIYSIPYKQYSELHFSSTTQDTSVVDVSTWYRLTFKRTSNGPKLIRLDYLVLEGE